MGFPLVFPPELIDIVFCQLDKQDLLSCSRSCRHLYQHTVPFLYKDIIFKQNAAPSSNAQETRVDTLDLLLRSIVSRPSLGNCIKRFTFQGAKNIHAWDNKGNPGSSTFNLQEAELTRSRIRHFSQVQVDLVSDSLRLRSSLWEEAFESGLIDAMLALFLLLVPKLESLVLDFDPISEEKPSFPYVGISLTLGSASHNLQSLNHVEFFFTAHFGQRYRQSFDQVAVSSLFYLPSLVSVNLIHLDASDFNWHRSRPPGFSSIQSLLCLDSYMNNERLKTWLSATSKLHTLQYDISVALNRVEAYWVDRTILLEGLSRVKDTLEDLDFQISYWSDEGDWGLVSDYHPIGRLAPFKEFAQLKHIIMPLTVLMGINPHKAPKLADMIPKSLVSLFSQDDGGSFDGWTWTIQSRNRLFTTLVHALSIDAFLSPNLALLGIIFSRTPETSLDLAQYDMKEVEDYCKESGYNFQKRFNNYDVWSSYFNPDDN
jgi:hypothetical protein